MLPVNTGLGPVTILAFAPPHAAAAAAAAAARRAQHRRRRRRHRRRDPSSRATIHRARSLSSSPRRDRPPARVGGVIARRPRDDVQFRARAERRTTARTAPRRTARATTAPIERYVFTRARTPRVHADVARVASRGDDCGRRRASLERSRGASRRYGVFDESRPIQSPPPKERSIARVQRSRRRPGAVGGTPS